MSISEVGRIILPQRGSWVRIAVFTGDDDIEASPWWPVLAATSDVAAVLVCRQPPAARRFWRNVRKHGFLWIPYRLGYAAVGVRWCLAPETKPVVTPAPRSIPVERLDTPSLAAPETVAWVTALKPDLGVSLGAPILKPGLFKVPVRGTLNLHQGAVPDFRGAPAGFWELMSGAHEIGATVHWVDAGLDAGRVVAAATAPLYGHDSLPTLQARAEELGQLVLAEALRLVAAGSAKGVPQPPGDRTFRIPLLSQRIALAARLAPRRASRALAPGAVVKTAVSVLALAVIRPLSDALRTLPRRHPLRVFNFHGVTSCEDIRRNRARASGRRAMRRASTTSSVRSCARRPVRPEPHRAGW